MLTTVLRELRTQRTRSYPGPIIPGASWPGRKSIVYKLSGCTLPVADIGFHFPPRPKFLAYRPKDSPPRRAPLKYWAETIPPPPPGPPCPPPPKSATAHCNHSGFPASLFILSQFPSEAALQTLAENWKTPFLDSNLSGASKIGL